MKNDKKTIILYVGSYLCALVSVFFYGFVGFPNNTSGGPGLFDFESTPGNVILFEIIPLLIALALSFASYFIYLRFLPFYKSKIFLIPEILILLVYAILFAYNLFMLLSVTGFVFDAVLMPFSIIVLGFGILPLCLHKEQTVKEEKHE